MKTEGTIVTILTVVTDVTVVKIVSVRIPFQKTKLELTAKGRNRIN